MNQSNNELNVDTSQWYAIFSGWLIVPNIVAIIDFLGAIIMVTFVQPSQFSGTEILIYYGDVIRLPLLFLIFFMLFKRKRLFPTLMIIYFALNIVLIITFYLNDLPLDT